MFKCEWFWSEINQLRNELSINSRKKHHIRSICLNSLKYIKELKNLSQESFEIGSNLRLEYLSYVNLIEGIVKNELKEFSSAFNCLQKSKIIIEELIKSDFNVSLLETKISEIETIMRVCQYSADMYDAVIEVNDFSDFNDFKINQLTELLSASEIKDNEQIFKIGSLSFKLSSEIQIGKPNLKNLQIARGILKKQQEGTVEYENALIQVSYFENRFYGKLIKRNLKKMMEKGPKFFDSSKLLKTLIRSIGFNVEENISKEFDLIARLLWNFTNIFDNNKDDLLVSKNASEALELIKSIKEHCQKNKNNFNLKMTLEIVKASKGLNRLLNGLLIKKAIYSFKESAPIPPKPSFYDMAFDCLSYEVEPVLLNQETTPVKQTGFSNLISGFWGKK